MELAEAIDPLAPGSIEQPAALAGSMLRSFGVDTTRPCCCQLRPFDTWQDPHDVLDAFALAKAELPALQLVLAGDPARGDLEAWRLLREVSDYAGERTYVLPLTGPGGLGSVELGALRRIARVALESTLAPASAITTIETLWAGTPVISAGARGAAHPVRDGSEGYLVDTPEAVAARLVELVADPGLAIELGAGGPRAGARALSHHPPPRGRARTARAVGGGDPATLQSHEGHASRRHQLELADGATGADAARAIGEGLARAALAIKVERRLRDLARRCADGEPIEIVTADSRGRARADPPRHRARARRPRCIELYPGVEDLDRPADRGRLLLRLRVPRGREDLGRRLRAHRGQDARARQGRRALRARPTCSVAMRSSASRARARTTRSS